MVEMWSNFQSIRFVNEHVRILGRRGKLRTRMCAGGSEICTAAYSFHGLKGGRSEGSFFVPNDTYAVGSSFGAASWMLAMHTGENHSEVVESAGDASAADNGNKAAVPVGGSGNSM